MYAYMATRAITYSLTCTNLLTKFNHRHHVQLSTQVLNTRSCTLSVLFPRRLFSLSTKMASGSNWIAALQMTSGSDKDVNMKVCNSLIEHAVAQKQAKMVFLPEGFDFISSGREETISLAETLEGPVINNYRNIAQKLGVWLSLGGFHHRLDDNPPETARIANSHVIIDGNGNVSAVYNKVHLFDVCLPEQKLELKESHTIKSGNELVKPVQTPVGKVGLAICYDIRFPEFSEKLRRRGAEILTYPSAFTVHTGQAHWEILLRSRAIENQCYVVAAAQVGKHNAKRSSYGHSMIINPWGTIMAQACASEQIIFAEIDLKELERVRSEMPLSNHKRYDLYEELEFYSTCTIPDETQGDEVFDFGQVKVKTKFVFLESKLSRAFVNRKCILPGHVLVISKRKAPQIKHLSNEEIADLHLLVKKVALVMESIQGSTSANIACQDGPQAGQSVQHVHVHVLPRREGDLEIPDEVHSRLENYGKNPEEPKWREEEDMLAECNMIRDKIRRDFSYFLH